MTSCLAGALLACLAQDQLGPVERALLHLARHQGADGLWGKRPPGCGCLVPRAWPEGGPDADATTKAAVAAVIGRLSDADIGVRAAAERELLRAGLPAVPQLRAAASGADAESAARCRGILDRLGRGLEESDPGLSGLSLLGFMGASYSHLSKDVYEGICFGTVVRRGLDALKARQREDGAFDSKDAVANVWAAIAMSEAYGLTGSSLWKEAAEKGLISVERALPKAARHAAWRALAARSGAVGEVWKSGLEPVRAMHEGLRGMEGTPAQAGCVVLESLLDRRRGGPRAEALAAIDPWTLEGEDLFLCTAGVRAGWGVSQEPGKAWMERVKDRLFRGTGDSRCGLGLSSGLRASAFRALTLEAYYRYGYSLGEAVHLTPLGR